jgi:hypothetical protein
MFKFELDQLVYYIRNDRLCSAKIISRLLADHALEGQGNNGLGPSREIYATCHGLLPVFDIFASRQELVDSLLEA